MFDGLGLRVLSLCFLMKVNKEIRSQNRLSYSKLKSSHYPQVGFEVLQFATLAFKLLGFQTKPST